MNYIIIPARLCSTRLPNKMLLNATGKRLILHTYENACRVKGVQQVIVATDSYEIAAVVRAAKGRVVVTSTLPRSGTERTIEVSDIINLRSDFIVNIQGDEPEFEPTDIERVFDTLRQHTGIVTLACFFDAGDDVACPDSVKVVTDNDQNAMYFSRLPIPFIKPDCPLIMPHLRHIGVYGYSPGLLFRLPSNQSIYEVAEGLEQLRYLQAGIKIKVLRTMVNYQRGIDTQETYDAFVARWRAK